MLEVLLEKDPGRRFQNPAEVLKTMPTITGAVDALRRITHQSFKKTPLANLGVGTRMPLARRGPKKISVARLPVTGRDVFGREEDIAFLRQNFPHWQSGGEVLRGWARSISGDTVEGISWIEEGIENYRATGSMWTVPYFSSTKG